MDEIEKKPPPPADLASPRPGVRKRSRATDDDVKEIKKLHALHFGTRKIAKKVGLGRKVVRGVICQLAPSPLMPAAEVPLAGMLDPFREAITEKVAVALTVTRILREIREKGYRGGRTILADFVRTLKPPIPRRKRIFRRFETGPGLEAQVDWSPYEVTIAGRNRVVHAFQVILAFSRKLHVRFYWNERESTLLEAHVEAFKDFGGVTQRFVYDRMATVVLGTIGKDREPIWHPRFIEFCRHFGYDPFLCQPRDPNRKGKCENGFWFLERDFLRGRKPASLEDLNLQAAIWLKEIANPRVHGTTGRIPETVFQEEEKPLLIRLPDSLFPTFDEEPREVGKDAVVWIRGTPYTIPAALAESRKVLVHLYSNHFEVLDQRGHVGFSRPYVPEEEKGRLVLVPAHYDGVAKKRSAPPGVSMRMEDGFLRRFPTLAELLAGLKVRMKSLFPVHLRSLLRIADRWGDDAFLPAATRAQHFRRFDAQAVQRILEKQNPLPDEEPECTSMAESRALIELGDVDGGSLDDYAHLDGKVTDEPKDQVSASPDGEEDSP